MVGATTRRSGVERRPRGPASHTGTPTNRNRPDPRTPMGKRREAPAGQSRKRWWYQRSIRAKCRSSPSSAAV